MYQEFIEIFKVDKTDIFGKLQQPIKDLRPIFSRILSESPFNMMTP